MAQIVSAEIIGIRAAQNTVGETTYNSTYYSVLVFYSDANTEVIEGELKDIRPLLRYVRPSPDTVTLLSMLESHENKIREMLRDHESYMDERIMSVFNGLKPVPAITHKAESEARRLLNELDFTVLRKREEPANAPEGIVGGFERTAEAPMTVVLDIHHPMPDVVGMDIEAASALLTSAGFSCTVFKKCLPNTDSGIVLDSYRQAPYSLKTDLTISVRIPELIGKERNYAAAELPRLGIDYRIVNVTDPHIPEGCVQCCVPEGDMSVRMDVSIGADMIYARSASVRGGFLKDSPEDRCSVAARFDNRAHELILSMTLESECRKPHMITGSAALLKSLSTNRVRINCLKGSKEVKSGSPLDFEVIITMPDSSVRPTSLSLSIEYSQGKVFAAKGNVSYDVTIDW